MFPFGVDHNYIKIISILDVVLKNKKQLIVSA